MTSTLITRPAAAPKPVSVSAWGEARGERTMPGCLRVLVDGQSAGGVELRGGSGLACWYTTTGPGGSLRDRMTEHDSPEAAVKAVVRSPWARRLGAGAKSAVSWSAKAKRLAGRGGKS